MDVDALEKSPIGSLVPIHGLDGRTGRSYDYFAFLADPLPDSIDLGARAWTLVSRAEGALGRLDEAARQVPEPGLLRRPSLRREAQSTSALEGTYATLHDVLASELDGASRVSAEIREVLNYIVAAEVAFRWVSDRPVTLGLLEHAQRELVRGTSSETTDPGRLRTIQVYIGPRSAPIEGSRFVPSPPGDQLRAGMEDLIAWMADDERFLSPVIVAAISHYQFETLHPFADGNGRIGRLLIVLQLMRMRVLEQPILEVSPWFEAHRNEYQDALFALSADGDWNPWVEFFATGLASAADTTRERIVRLFAWRENAIAAARNANLSGVAERLVADLISTPILNAGTVARNYSVTPQAAMNALRRAADIGLLEERRRGGRVSFVAPEPIGLINA